MPRTQPMPRFRSVLRPCSPRNPAYLGTFTPQRVEESFCVPSEIPLAQTLMACPTLGPEMIWRHVRHKVWSAVDVIKAAGYPVEVHGHCVTEDHYLMEIVRIMRPGEHPFSMLEPAMT